MIATTRSLAMRGGARPYRLLSSESSPVVSLVDHTVTVGGSLTLVEGLTLELNEGERWAILGHNGCGK